MIKRNALRWTVTFSWWIQQFDTQDYENADASDAFKVIGFGMREPRERSRIVGKCSLIRNDWAIYLRFESGDKILFENVR